MNVRNRGKLALILLMMSLASVCYALRATNGWGVGLNCHTKYPGDDKANRNNFNACCEGDCSALYDEATDPVKYNDCKSHAYYCEKDLAGCAVKATTVPMQGISVYQPIIVRPTTLPSLPRKPVAK